ncbi:MAG: hypothetical protein HYS09_05425 [Chloroflexi bacterium]|nr:hypothetical protein [Chloroflexota bacterium]
MIPFRFFLPIGTIITVFALAFTAYVLLDEDMRTLVWNKWTGNVAYEFPGDDRNITIKVGLDGEETEFDVP